MDKIHSTCENNHNSADNIQDYVIHKSIKRKGNYRQCISNSRY